MIKLHKDAGKGSTDLLNYYKSGLANYQCGCGMSTFYCPYNTRGWAAFSFKCLPFDVPLKAC